MRFLIKTACNFWSFSGNLNSLEDVSDEVNDGDQEVQPQTENPNRKKTKEAEKKKIRTGPADRNSSRILGHAWKIRKKAPIIYGKNDNENKKTRTREKGKETGHFFSN